MATFNYSLPLLLSIAILSFPVASQADDESDFPKLPEKISTQPHPYDPVEQFKLAKSYDLGEGQQQDKSLALIWYKKSAEQGYAEAQLLLGLIYDQGMGVEQDYNEAVYWYRKAANQDYAKAQYNLAAMYDEGLGVAQDFAQAANWYQKAAEQGYAKAEFNLGSMYFNGEGVEQDNIKAYMWLHLAAEQGLQKQVKKRIALVKNLTPDQIKKAKKLASNWLIEHTPVKLKLDY